MPVPITVKLLRTSDEEKNFLKTMKEKRLYKLKSNVTISYEKRLNPKGGSMTFFM